MAGEIFIAKEETLQSVLTAVNGLVTKADSIGTAVDTANTNISTANGKLDNIPTNDTIGNYVGGKVVKSKQLFKYPISSLGAAKNGLYSLSIPISTIDANKCLVTIDNDDIMTVKGSTVSSADDLAVCGVHIESISNTSIVVAYTKNSYITPLSFENIKFSLQVIEFY